MLFAVPLVYQVMQMSGKSRKAVVAQTTISPAFQTTLAADVVRALGLKPGMILSQTVEGDRLVMEPLHDIDALAGSLGRGRAAPSIQKLKQGAKAALARAAR